MGWWRFEDAAVSNSAQDATGKSNDATLVVLDPKSAGVAGRRVSLRLYVNGVEAGNVASSGVCTPDNSKVTLCGNQNNAAGNIEEAFNGLVDDLQLYKRGLLAAEVAALAK